VRRLPALIAAAVAVVIWLAPGRPASALALAPTSSGYWVKGGLAIPTVPKGGLVVAADGTSALAPSSPIGSELPFPVPVPSSAGSLIGPAAISAIRIDGISGSADATLSLDVETGSVVPSPSLTTILACPLSSALVTAPHGGDIADAPGYDCAEGSPGRVAGDNSSISWLLPAAMQISPGEIDVALVPDPSGLPIAFAVTFAAPGSSSVRAASGSAPLAPIVTALSGARPVTAAPAPATAPLGFSGLPAVPSAGFSAPAGGVASTSPSQTGTPSIAPTVGLETLAGVRLPGDDRFHRTMAVLVLLGVAAAWWWASGREERAPRLLGALAGRAPAVSVPASGRDGGNGRFARPRDTPPRRL
jgi:hypothetical protein